MAAVRVFRASYSWRRASERVRASTIKPSAGTADAANCSWRQTLRAFVDLQRDPDVARREMFSKVFLWWRLPPFAHHRVDRSAAPLAMRRLSRRTRNRHRRLRRNRPCRRRPPRSVPPGTPARAYPGGEHLFVLFVAHGASMVSASLRHKGFHVLPSCARVDRRFPVRMTRCMEVRALKSLTA